MAVGIATVTGERHRGRELTPGLHWLSCFVLGFVPTTCVFAKISSLVEHVMIVVRGVTQGPYEYVYPLFIVSIILSVVIAGGNIE